MTTELKKLLKKLAKLEREFEKAPAVRKGRIMKSAKATEKRIAMLELR